MSLINCEVSLILTWSKNCALTDLIKRAADPNVNPAVVAIAPVTDATFKIIDTKLLLLFQLKMTARSQTKTKTEVNRTIKWNKYRSETSNQAKNNIFTFTNVIRLFILSFQNERDSTSYWEYCE